MSRSALNTAEVFGIDDPVALAKAVDAFTQAAAESFAKGAAGMFHHSMPNLPGYQESGADLLAKAVSDPSLAKAIDPATLAAVQGAVETYQAKQADLVKDLTLTSPLSTGFVPFDLEAPAKYLAPRPTPLRNKIPRKRGQGTSHRYKRITGITGSGTGGVGVFHPGITDTTQTNFAPSGAGNALYLNRGAKISYAGDEATLLYMPFSASDAVPWSAQFAGVGFQDTRAVSQQSLLYSSMLLEERMLLMGRGTGAGYLGALTAPGSAPTGAARSAAAGETGISGATTNVYVKYTWDAGDFGQSTLSAASAAIAVTNGQVVDVTLPAFPAGAVGARIYVSTGAADPGDASRWYAGRTGYTTFTITGALPTSGVAASTVTADTSAYASGYDGILPIVAGPNSGYVGRINGAFSTSNPGSEYQAAFAAIYNAVKGDPDEIWMQGLDRKQLSDALKTGGSATNYRLTIQQGETGGVVLGNIVSQILNEITGKVVDLTVHPWMPQGNSAVLSYTLPIPDSNVSDVWNVWNVQDYMGVQWPVTQFQYEFSSYWYGTFGCVAPAWNGFVGGIKSV